MGRCEDGNPHNPPESQGRNVMSMTVYSRAKGRGGARKLLLAAASSAIALAIASPVAAQETPAAADSPSTTEQDIVVTGIRASLQRNLDVKRTASGVVD